MTTPIRRKKSTTSITGMTPPPDTAGIGGNAAMGKYRFVGEPHDELPHEGGRSEGVDESFLENNRKSVDEAQRNIRSLQDQIDTLLSRIAELESFNEPLPEEDVDIELVAGTNIAIAHQGKKRIISSTAEESAAGDTYAGHFKVTDNGNDTVDIAAGKIINGTTVTTVAAEAALSVTSMTYVSLEIWYNATWKTNYLAGSSYPTQADKSDGGTDYPCLRVLITEKVDDSWIQQQFGEIHNTRLV
jgi:hypothetical protein